MKVTLSDGSSISFLVGADSIEIRLDGTTIFVGDTGGMRTIRDALTRAIIYAEVMKEAEPEVKMSRLTASRREADEDEDEEG